MPRSTVLSSTGYGGVGHHGVHHRWPVSATGATDVETLAILVTRPQRRMTRRTIARHRRMRPYGLRPGIRSYCHDDHHFTYDCPGEKPRSMSAKARQDGRKSAAELN